MDPHVPPISAVHNSGIREQNISAIYQIASVIFLCDVQVDPRRTPRLGVTKCLEHLGDEADNLNI